MAATVRAAVVDYQFTGTVNNVWGSSVYGIAPTIGIPVTGSFSYDTSVADTTPGSGIDTYPQVSPNGFSFTLAGLRLATHAGFTATLQRSGYDSIQMFPPQPVVDVNGAPRFCNSFELLLDDTTGRFLASDRFDLLPSIWHLSQLTLAQGEISDPSGGAIFTIDTLTPVPDQSSRITLLLTIFVFILARFIWRKTGVG